MVNLLVERTVDADSPLAGAPFKTGERIGGGGTRSTSLKSTLEDRPSMCGRSESECAPER